MKKCPYCAEEIQDNVVFCLHCKSELFPSPVSSRQIFKWFVIATLVLIAIGIYGLVKILYIIITTVVIWYLWKKSKFNKHTKIKASVALMIVFLLLESLIVYNGRTPTLIITEPQNGISVQAPVVILKGKIIPSKSKIVINEKNIEVDKTGLFNYEMNLVDEQNIANIKATNGKNIATTSIFIKRIFTVEEKVEIDRQKVEDKVKKQRESEARKKVRIEQVAKIRAIEEKKYKDLGDVFCTSRSKQYSVYANLDDFSKMLESGEVTTIHNVFDQAPSKASCRRIAEQCLKRWSKTECEGMAEQKIWIGMTANQLMLSLGVPKDKNNTVGAWGISTQWVYSDFGPYVYLEGDSEDDLTVTSWQD